MSINTPTKQIAPYQAVASPLPDIVGLGGTVAGLAGGIAMAAVGAIISLSLGGDIWLEAKQIAAPIFGPTVVRPGFDAAPVLVGTIIHLAISALLGAIYGIVLRRILNLPSDLGVPVLSGLIYGMALWMVAYFLVLPLVNRFLLGTYAPAFIVQHLVYGMVTGLVYSRLRPAPYINDPSARTRMRD